MKIYDIFFRDSSIVDDEDYKPLNEENFQFWTEIIEKVIVDISDGAADTNRKPMIERFYQCLKKLMTICQNDKKVIGKSRKEMNHYYLVITEEKLEEYILKKLKPNEIGPRIKETRKIGFWCFNPAVGFNKIQELNPRTIILTSGTLSPLNEF